MSPSGGLAVRSTGIHQAGESGAANAAEGESILQIKFSLRFAMIMIAIGACFMPMLGGILGLSSYDTYRLQEQKYRDALPDLRRREGVAKFVTEFERGAVRAAENAQKSREAFTTARVLVGLGLISGWLAISLRLWFGPGIPTRSRPAYYLFSACSTLTLILLASFALAAALWIGVKLIFIAIQYIVLLF